jgi:predicted PurR-regulated permease PerM
MSGKGSGEDPAGAGAPAGADAGKTPAAGAGPAGAAGAEPSPARPSARTPAAAPAAGAPAPRGGWDLGLGNGQRKLLRAAVTILALLVVVVAVGALGKLLVDFLRAFSNVFLPLAVAGILALVLNPYFEWLRDRARLPTPLAVAAVFLTLVAPLVAFFWFFGALAANQIGDLLRRLPDWWAAMVETARARWPQVQHFFEENPLGQRLREAAAGQAGAIAAGLQTMGTKALSFGASFLRGVGVVFTWAVLPVYLIFFLLADRSSLRNWEREVFPFLKEETRRDVVFLGGEFVRLVVTFFRGQLIIAAAQAILYAFGFQLAGLRYGFILGLTLGFLNLIPYLGSIVGLGIALPLALFKEGGGWWLVAVIAGVFTGVQMIEAYLLTPRIMGDRTGLHPMAVIVAIFFWGTALNGILGMILAIPLTAFLVVAWRLARERYIREWI